MRSEICFYCTQPIGQYYFEVNMADISDRLCARCYCFLRLAGRDMEKDEEKVPGAPRQRGKFRYVEKKENEKQNKA